jgi:hypothetical protein
MMKTSRTYKVSLASWFCSNIHDYVSCPLGVQENGEHDYSVQLCEQCSPEHTLFHHLQGVFYYLEFLPSPMKTLLCMKFHYIRITTSGFIFLRTWHAYKETVAIPIKISCSVKFGTDFTSQTNIRL